MQVDGSRVADVQEQAIFTTLHMCLGLVHNLPYWWIKWSQCPSFKIAHRQFLVPFLATFLASQSPELTGRERLATKLRVAEKQILSQFMDAVRRKLAPIRGIPTKSGGMQDPNQDLKEIFDAIEGIPAAPAKLFDNIKRWAAGEFDPDWNKPPK
jgi:hypothetical protein